MYFVLKGKEPVPEPNILKWARWFEKENRVVKQEKHKGLLISTVFLGINHQFGEGPPLLFETMIFGGAEEYQKRCSTWEEALLQHKRAVGKINEVQVEGAEL